MILVSGATGFVGSYLVCNLLHQNKKVRALKRESSNLSEFEFICKVNAITPEQLKNLEWVTTDILDLGDLEIGTHAMQIKIPQGLPEGTSFSSWNISGVLIGE